MSVPLGHWSRVFQGQPYRLFAEFLKKSKVVRIEDTPYLVLNYPGRVCEALSLPADAYYKPFSNDHCFVISMREKGNGTWAVLFENEVTARAFLSSPQRGALYEQIDFAIRAGKLEDPPVEIAYPPAFREEIPEDETGAALFIGCTPEIVVLRQRVHRFARTKASLLFQGETGTGKEVLAYMYHDASARRMKPFIPINCGAIPENLVETELFGHVRGAFTSAIKQHAGVFERADGGTVFLDEVGELPPSAQVKLLRVLQDGIINRVGGEEPIPVDVRVVAATNRFLEEEVRMGTFRPDLFYRFNFCLTIPPLRDRQKDIPLLVDHLLPIVAEELELGRTPELSSNALHALQEYSWPGNVRELHNVLGQAMLELGGGEIIVPTHLPKKIFDRNTLAAGGLTQSVATIRELERRAIISAMEASDNDKRKAAHLLGIALKTLYNKIAKYGLQFQKKV